MNRLCTASAVVIWLLSSAVAPALAAPPTVTPSPGYDARLKESRKAAATTTSTAVRTAPRHRAKRVADEIRAGLEDRELRSVPQ